MTNRDKLLNMSLYDLIMSVNCHRGCKLAVITDELLTQICYEHKGKCSECIADWLNREAKYSNKNLDFVERSVYVESINSLRGIAEGMLGV